MGTKDNTLPSFDDLPDAAWVPEWAKDQPANKNTAKGNSLPKGYVVDNPPPASSGNTPRSSAKDDWRPVGHDAPDWAKDKPAFDPNKPYDELPDAPWAQSKPPFDPDEYLASKQTTSGAEAGVQGAITGATAGWAPQLSGVEEASGIPGFGTHNLLGHQARLGVGAARLAWEHLTGNRGPATEEYEKTRDALQKRQASMQAEHPWAYGGGELAGAVVPMLAAPEAEAAGVGARMLQGAKLGAGYGAASGASEGFEKNGVPGALQGAGLGAVEGGIGGAGGELGGTLLGKAAGKAYDLFGRPLVSTARGWMAPEREAAMRVWGAIQRDYPQVADGKALGLTPSQWAEAKASGAPVMIADLGGETTRALARSAANTSPEGRAALQQAIHDRFAQQSDRAGSTVRGLVSGGADAMKTRAQLEAEYDLERGAAYRGAYQAGDRPLWSPELERLTSAPAVADALRGAVNRWRDWQVLDGYGGMNPPVNITQDGLLQFSGGKGMLPHPNLQLWDYAARNLAGMASVAARTGNNQEAARLGGLERLLKTELDRQVPQFANARGVAARYFGGNNALEAGAQAINFKGNPTELRLALNGMRPAERGMFQEAYADALARKMEATSDNRDLTLRMFNSPQERAKIGAVFGPQGVNKLEAFMHRETIFDAARKALGNSTTVRQMIESGLAGGAIGSYLTGDWHGGIGGVFSGMAARKLAPEMAMTGVRTALGYVDRNTATRVAKLLASDDPRELMQGLQIASRNQRVMHSLREMGAKAVTALGSIRRARIPVSQLPTNAGNNPFDQFDAKDSDGQKSGAFDPDAYLKDTKPSFTDKLTQTWPVKAAQNIYHVVTPPHSEGPWADFPPARAHGGAVFSPEAIGARKAKNGHWYVADPERPGKFMIVLPKKGAVRGDAADKVSKAQAHYTDTRGKPGHMCSICTHILWPDHCSLVTGKIKPGGGCDLFKRKRKVA